MLDVVCLTKINFFKIIFALASSVLATWKSLDGFRKDELVSPCDRQLNKSLAIICSTLLFLVCPKEAVEYDTTHDECDIIQVIKLSQSYLVDVLPDCYHNMNAPPCFQIWCHEREIMPFTYHVVTHNIVCVAFAFVFSFFFSEYLNFFTILMSFVFFISVPFPLHACVRPFVSFMGCNLVSFSAVAPLRPLAPPYLLIWRAAGYWGMTQSSQGCTFTSHTLSRW